MDDPTLHGFMRAHSNMADARMQEIAARFHPCTLAKGDHLLREREVNDRYLVIGNGWLRSFAIDTEGEEVTTAFSGPGQVVFDADSGCFVDVNENAGRLFGLDREQLLRVGPAELSPPLQPDGTVSREQVRTKIERALDAGPITFEWLHRDAFGKEFMCDVRLLRLPSGSRRLGSAQVMHQAVPQRSTQLRRRAHATHPRGDAARPGTPVRCNSQIPLRSCPTRPAPSAGYPAQQAAPRASPPRPQPASQT